MRSVSKYYYNWSFLYRTILNSVCCASCCLSCMQCYFNDTIIHWPLTLATSSLMCVCGFLYVYVTHGRRRFDLRLNLTRRTFAVEYALYDYGGLSGQVQHLPLSRHQFLWWPWLPVVLNLASGSKCSGSAPLALHCPASAVKVLKPGNSGRCFRMHFNTLLLQVSV